MKIYCNEIELSKPAPIQIWVSKNSDYGLGLYVTKNGVGTSFLLYDGETQLSSSSTLDKYTVYNITAANKAETKVLTVKSNNQEVKISVNTTASNCAEYTPPVPPPAEPGLDEQGVKDLLSSNNVQQINTTTVYTTNVFALQQVNGNLVTATNATLNDITTDNVNATDMKVGSLSVTSQLVCNEAAVLIPNLTTTDLNASNFTTMNLTATELISYNGISSSNLQGSTVNVGMFGTGQLKLLDGSTMSFYDGSGEGETPVTLTKEDVVKLKALIANP